METKLTEKYGFNLMWYEGRYWKVDPHIPYHLIDLRNPSKGKTLNNPSKAYICLDEEQYKAVGGDYLKEDENLPAELLKKSVHRIISRLRNPYGHNMEEIREEAVNTIEKLHDLVKGEQND